MAMENIMSISRVTKLSLALVFVTFVAGCVVVDKVKYDFVLLNAEKAVESGNYSSAADQYRKAAELGSGEGAFWLSELYLGGKGVKKDTPSGLKWMQTASDRNYLPAQVMIGFWTLSGSNGIRKDETRGAQIMLKAAEAKQPIAMAAMGYLYMRGTGVKRNAAQALDWFQRANAAGFFVPHELLTLPGVEKTMGVKR